MKRRICLLVVVLFCVGIFSIGESNPGEALYNVNSVLANVISANSGYANFKMNGNPIQWKAMKGQKKTFTHYLQAGKNYLWIVSGDNDTYDIDMTVYDIHGNIAAVDIRTPECRGCEGTDAGVRLTVFQAGNYRIETNLFDAVHGYVDMVMIWRKFY